MKKSSGLTRHRRKTEIHLVVLGFLLLLGIGGPLVWVLYGSSAAITAMVCISSFGGILGLLWLMLTLLELWVKEDDA